MFKYHYHPIQSICNKRNESIISLYDGIRGFGYKYEQSNGQIVGSINGRVDVESKGDEIEVADKELSIMVSKGRS